MSVDALRRGRSNQRPDEEFDPTHSYRALSTLAVCSLALSVLSIAAVLDWWLGVIPAVGIAAGLLALRKIARNPTELTGERLALAGIMLSSLSLCIGWSRLAYVVATEVPPGYQRISYDLLQPDTAVRGQVVPPAAEALEGQRVFLRGYAYPGPQTTGIKKFVLVRDNQQCCFGGNPKLTDMVEVTLEGSLAMNYTTAMRRVAGTFHVSHGNGIDGLRHVIYHLDADYLQ